MSLKTVSRVVNAEPGVAQETAARVTAAIQALGFTRNELARSLRHGRAGALGLVIEDVANPFYSQLARTVEELAHAQGHLLLTGSCGEDPAREQELVLRFLRRAVDAVLMVPAGGEHTYLQAELEQPGHAPIVFVDRPPVGVDVDTVLGDSRGGARMAVEHLVAHGHRRIAVITDSDRVWTARERVAGAVDALHDAGVIEQRPPTVGADRALYVAVGERWFRSGHSLDELQAGYHLGARVVWRRIAAVATQARAEAATIGVLADALFAYLDEIAAVTVEGFVAAQAAAAGEVERRRARLLGCLIADPQTERAVLERAALEAGWPLPRALAAVALGTDAAPRRLPNDVLAGVVDGVACLIVPDPDGPGRRAPLQAALAGHAAALGPTTPVEHAARSWSRARALHALQLEPAGLHAADDHLLELLLAEDPSLVDDLARLRLAPLASLPPRSRATLHQTLLAYLRHRGNGPRMAADLHVHPQTVRYRLARLRELLGDALDDPEARFELEVVLRARAVRASPTTSD